MEGNSKKNNYDCHKIVLRMFIVLFSLCLVTITVITITSTIKSSGNLAFGKYEFFVTREDNKTNATEKGDLIIVNKDATNEIKVGDSIVYEDNKIYYCDDVIQTRNVNNELKVIIKENDIIKYQFDEREIEGKVTFKVHRIGNIIIFLRTPIGIILFILFIICLFYLLRRLLVNYKNKYIKQIKND